MTSSLDISSKHITLLAAGMPGELRHCMSMLGCDHPVSSFSSLPPPSFPLPFVYFHHDFHLSYLFHIILSSYHHHFHYLILSFFSSLHFYFSSMLLPFSILHYLAVFFPFFLFPFPFFSFSFSFLFLFFPF